MLNIYVPQVLYGRHDSERVICADLTRVGHTVYMHVAHYPDFSAPLDAIELRQGGLSLRGTPVGQPETMAYRFEVPAHCSDFHFMVYTGEQFCGRVQAQAYQPQNQVFLTAATLFKGDYAQMRTWMDHHAAIGFERFVLYYNGQLSEILPELLAHDAVRNKDVLLVQWPFSYWVDGLALGIEGLLALHGDQADTSLSPRDWHHAQQLMLHHALLTLAGTTEYVGFFDLDEYFSLNSPMSLPDMLRGNGQDIYVFQSRWAELTSNRVPTLADGADFFDHDEVQVSEWIPVPHRSKYIGRPERILGTGAHVPTATTPETAMAAVRPTVAGLLHFHCFSGKASRRNFVNPTGQWWTLPRFPGVGVTSSVDGGRDARVS